MYTTSMQVWRSSVDQTVLVEFESGDNCVRVPCLTMDYKKIAETIEALQQAQALIRISDPDAHPAPSKP